MEGFKKHVKCVELRFIVNDDEERRLMQMMETPLSGGNPDDEDALSKKVRLAIYDTIVDGRSSRS